MKKFTITMTVLAVLGISLNIQVGAQDTTPKDPYAGDFWSRSTLTGDWGGLRNEWAQKGVTIDLNVTQIGQAWSMAARAALGSTAGGATSQSISIARSLACGPEDFST